MNWLKKPYRFALAYTTMLVSVSSLIVLDAFVIPHAQTAVVSNVAVASTNTVAQTSTATAESATLTSTTTPTITDTSYQDDNISINIQQTRAYDTDIYVAEIKLSNPSLLKTALANNTFGRNIKAKTSDIASEHQAIFAINGDYYGFRDDGAVLRNGTLYRTTQRQGDMSDALVIDQTGNFSIIDEQTTDVSTLDTTNIAQILSFGPALIQDGQVSVSDQDEVTTKSHSNENPRTAIGMVSPLHYYVVVTDGRSDTSTGLTLKELATVMSEYQVQVAYNLDGGGSSTMVFNGKVVNKPTTNGHEISERAVSDIVYFGYN